MGGADEPRRGRSGSAHQRHELLINKARSKLDFVRIQGSVAPKSVRWALPCAALTVFYHQLIHEWTDWAQSLDQPMVSETTMWTLFTSILGFLVVFRAQLSYARYWEGITLVERACAVWMNGVSNLIAFCSADPQKQESVDEFQYILSRLMSLLVCHSMCEISRRDRSHFPHLDLDGIDPACLQYLEDTSARQSVVLQWLQRLVVENSRSGVLDIAAPILSRVFQELSIGIVHFVDAKKLTAVPFPFQFAQMVVIMLVFFSVATVPLICAVGISNVFRAAVYTFLIVFVFWSVHYIAVEIEHPFGEDPNDLPLEGLNHRFNRVLLRLLEHKAQHTPSLLKKPAIAMRLMRQESSVAGGRSSSAPSGRGRRKVSQIFRNAVLGTKPGPRAEAADAMFDWPSQTPPDDFDDPPADLCRPALEEGDAETEGFGDDSVCECSRPGCECSRRGGEDRGEDGEDDGSDSVESLFGHGEYTMPATRPATRPDPTLTPPSRPSRPSAGALRAAAAQTRGEEAEAVASTALSEARAEVGRDRLLGRGPPVPRGCLVLNCLGGLPARPR